MSEIAEQRVARPLLTPDEVRNMHAETELLFIAGQRPIVATKLRYYADPEFSGLFGKQDRVRQERRARRSHHPDESIGPDRFTNVVGRSEPFFAILPA